MSTSNNDAQNGTEQDSKKITFKFCRECSNMLYPQEDRENNRLFFSCRTCTYSEPPVTACVYRNDLSNKVGETAGITQDIGQDPTVCTSSSSLEAFFPELCTMCGQEITCDTCGRPNAHGVWLEVSDRDEETHVPAVTATNAGATNEYEHVDVDDAIDFYDEGMLSDPESDDDHGEYYVAAANGHGSPHDDSEGNQRQDASTIRPS